MHPRAFNYADAVYIFIYTLYSWMGDISWIFHVWWHHGETVQEKTSSSFPSTYQLLIALVLVVGLHVNVFFFMLETDLAWAAVESCMLSSLLWVHTCSCLFVCVNKENVVFISCFCLFVFLLPFPQWSLCLGRRFVV